MSSWQLISPYDVNRFYTSVCVGAGSVSPGKVNRLLVCHIPFHWERSFWQRSCYSARWLKGCQVQSKWSVSPNVPSHKSTRRGKTHRCYVALQHPLYVQMFIPGFICTKIYSVCNFKHLNAIVCEGWRMLQWLWAVGHDMAYPRWVMQGHIYSSQWMFSSAGFWTSCSLCSAVGPLNVGSDIFLLVRGNILNRILFYSYKVLFIQR